jgi:hypothetical protein
MYVDIYCTMRYYRSTKLFLFGLRYVVISKYENVQKLKIEDRL